VRIAVVDASPLINLDHLGLLIRLPAFFDIIYVPREIHTEVCRKSRFRYRLGKLYREGRFVKCVAANESNLQLLLDDPDMDRGEAEALTQAQEQEARFFIGDDAPARRIAERMSFTPVGTARLIFRLHLEGYAENPWKLIRRLRRDLKFRISDSLVLEAQDRAPEPI
jgi:predicted nucleic acid-binding protein